MKPMLSLFFLFLLLFLFFSIQPLYGGEEGAVIEALYLEFFPQEGRLLGETDVVFILGDYYITADWMEILFDEHILTAKGNVFLQGPESIAGEKLQLDLLEMEGSIWEGDIKEKDFRLEALQFVFSSDRIMLVDALYSPCPGGCDDLYITARRFMLSPEMRLTGYHIHFYVLGVKVFYLPRYSGWIRQGHFYPVTPIPYPGFSSDQGFFVDVNYRHWLGMDMVGDYNLFLAQDDYYLQLDYSFGPHWRSSIGYGVDRSGFLMQFDSNRSLNLSLVFQEGENLFLEKGRKDPVKFWPSLTLQIENLQLPAPLYLSTSLGLEQVAEGEGEYLLRSTGQLQLESHRLSLIEGLSWKGVLSGQIRTYERGEELLEYAVKNNLLWSIHPLLTLDVNHQLVGLEGYTPFLFDDPLPGEDMQGLRWYQDVFLQGAADFRGFDFRWKLGEGLVKYPTGDDFGYRELQLTTGCQPLPRLHIGGRYNYRELEGIPLLRDDAKKEQNHFMQQIGYTLRPTDLPLLRWNLKGEWSFLEDDWTEITLGMGTAYGGRADRFQFAVSTSYDILEEEWHKDGLVMECTIRTSKSMPYWQLGVKGTYDLIQEELERTLLSLRRESPCFFILLQVEEKEGELFWELRYGSKF